MGCGCGKGDQSKWAVVYPNGQEVVFNSEQEATDFMSRQLPGSLPYSLRAPVKQPG